MEAWLRLLASYVQDAARLREYEAALRRDARYEKLLLAWNALQRDTAYAETIRHQSLWALRNYLEYSISRRCPPPGWEESVELWEVVRSHLERQLSLLG